MLLFVILEKFVKTPIMLPKLIGKFIQFAKNFTAILGLSNFGQTCYMLVKYWWRTVKNKHAINAIFAIKN